MYVFALTRAVHGSSLSGVALSPNSIRGAYSIPLCSNPPKFDGVVYTDGKMLPPPRPPLNVGQ